MKHNQQLIQKFCTAAEKVSAVVKDVGTTAAAFSYIMKLCVGKSSCRLMASGCEAPLSADAGRVCDQKQQKIIAASLPDPGDTSQLADLCDEHNIGFVSENLRDHLAGVDIGVTLADFAVADTGTLVIDSSGEDLRLTTMISEIHAAILPKSRIRDTIFDVEDALCKMMKTAPNYCSFISGASRTADIERVLALGVHGPLELHILLTEA